MTTTLTLPDAAKARAYFEAKMAFTTGPIELDRMLKAHENLTVIDVRAEEAFNRGHIPDAINLPREKWSSLEGLHKDRTNVVYCYSQQCHLGAAACFEFASRGYPVMELEGGFATWKQYDLDVQRAPHNRVFRRKHSVAHAQTASHARLA